MILGIIIGFILALALAFAVTMMWVKSSNDLGDSEGTYEHFTGSEMKFISKKK